MAIEKQHLEFEKLDLNEGWEVPQGYPVGIEHKILSGMLDEEGGKGHRTRLLRFHAGAFTEAPFCHEYWEEVYLLSGDLIVGNNSQGKGGKSFMPPTYACRPPRIPHGPFKSEQGCLLLEVHYFDLA